MGIDMDALQLKRQVNEMIAGGRYDDIKETLLSWKDTTEHDNELAMLCYLCTIYEQEKAAKELADREAKIAARERKADALDILAKNDVPSEFVDILVGDTTEKTKANVAAFKGKFDAAVQAQVEKRLAGTTPKGSSGTGTVSEEEAMAAEIDKYL